MPVPCPKPALFSFDGKKTHDVGDAFELFISCQNSQIVFDFNTLVRLGEKFNAESQYNRCPVFSRVLEGDNFLYSTHGVSKVENTFQQMPSYCPFYIPLVSGHCKSQQSLRMALVHTKKNGPLTQVLQLTPSTTTCFFTLTWHVSVPTRINRRQLTNSCLKMCHHCAAVVCIHHPISQLQRCTHL